MVATSGDSTLRLWDAVPGTGERCDRLRFHMEVTNLYGIVTSRTARLTVVCCPLSFTGQTVFIPGETETDLTARIYVEQADTHFFPPLTAARSEVVTLGAGR